MTDLRTQLALLENDGQLVTVTTHANGVTRRERVTLTLPEPRAEDAEGDS